MKKFKFEINLSEDMLSGDEFWEDAIKRDGTGIADLTEYLQTIIRDSNILMGDTEPKDVIKLIKYSEE